VQLDWVPVRRTTAFAVAGRAPSPCLAGRRRPSSPPPVRAASGFARARSSSQCKSRSEWYTPVPYRVSAAARRRSPPRFASPPAARRRRSLAQLLRRPMAAQRPRSRRAAGQTGAYRSKVSPPGQTHCS
jgi:hypothetical protein